MVVWENFLTDDATLASISIKLFPFGIGFTNGTYSFVVQKNSGKWYASAPIELTKATSTADAPIDPTTLIWHVFTPLNNGVGTIGAVTAIDMNGIKTVDYYSDIRGDECFKRLKTFFFQAKAFSGPPQALFAPTK